MIEILSNRADISYQVDGVELSTFSEVAFERKKDMGCKFYCGNGCSGCSHFVKSTSIAIVNSALRITIPNEILVNEQKLCLCLAQVIPTGITPNMPVVIFINNVVIPLRTMCGNAVYADQVRSRKIYPLNIATDVPTVTVTNSNKLCKTARAFSPILAPSVTSAIESNIEF